MYKINKLKFEENEDDDDDDEGKVKPNFIC